MQIWGDRIELTSSNQGFLRTDMFRMHQPTLGHSRDARPNYPIELHIGHAE